MYLQLGYAFIHVCVCIYVCLSVLPLNTYTTLLIYTLCTPVYLHTQVLVVTNVPNSLYNQDYFTLEQTLINNILTTNTQYLNKNSITAISYILGAPVDYTLAIQYITNTSVLYHTKAAADYRGLTGHLANYNQAAAMIVLTTITDPDADSIVPFILNTRKVLGTFQGSNLWRGHKIETYLFGT